MTRYANKVCGGTKPFYIILLRLFLCVPVCASVCAHARLSVCAQMYARIRPHYAIYLGIKGELDLVTSFRHVGPGHSSG